MKRKEAIKKLIKTRDLTGDICSSLGIKGENWAKYIVLPKDQKEQIIIELIKVYEVELANMHQPIFLRWIKRFSKRR